MNSTATDPNSTANDTSSRPSVEPTSTVLARLGGPIHGTHSQPSLRLAKGVGLPQLVLIELRKAVDTRAGLWMMIVMCAIVAVVCGAYAIWGEGPASAKTFSDYFGLTIMPLALLLPVLGIMSATQEWSQRTGLTTFALEPRRGRIVTAKVLAGALLGLVVVGVSMLSAALVTLVTGGELTLAGVSLWGVLVMLTLFVLQGVGFGLALLNTPLAIVGSLVLPTVWTILVGMFAWAKSLGTWLDLNQVTEPLVQGQMTGEHWAHLATGAGLWIALPLAIGTWRVLTREVK